jgi:hypothetical protein
MLTKTKLIMFSTVISFSINTYAGVSDNAFTLIVAPLINQNLSTFSPVPTDAAAGYQSNACINGGEGCFYTRSLARGSIGSPAGGIVGQGFVTGDSGNYNWAYGTYNYQGPNGLIQAAAGADYNSASVSLRFQNKDLIGSGIGGIDSNGNLGLSVQTQTKDGFDQAVIGGSLANGLIGATVQSQSNLGFAQYAVSGDGKQSASTFTPDGWSVSTANSSNGTANTFAVTSSETQSYNKLNMENNRITNLSPGISGNDAVNLNQLNSGLKLSYQGIAGVAALNGIPSVPSDKKFNIGLGVGNYEGQSAVALGGNVRFTDKVAGKFGLGISGGNVTSSAGVGIAF